MLTHPPSVRARITMLQSLEHSRWPNRGYYMPHIVLGDPSKRVPELIGNSLVEQYLGILMKDSPEELVPGQSSEVTLVFT
jgi:hypothetical protein